MQVRQIRVDVRGKIEERVDPSSVCCGRAPSASVLDEEELLAREEPEPALDLLCVPASRRRYDQQPIGQLL